MMEENPNAFKLWINESVIQKYFNKTKLSKKEIQRITSQLSSLELRARVKLIANELKMVLSDDYPKALLELLQITQQEKITSFALWPASEFIQMYGLDHVEESIAAMHELTSKFTAEFCIRPFINRYGDLIYDRLNAFTNDESDHIRRWLSEGTRPRLPWGEKLRGAVQDPQRGLEILEHLKFDPSLYVRKSVANHLNDIAKDHPALVVKTLLRWKKMVPPGFEKEFLFICRRALRTLIKNGDNAALKFSGIEVQQSHIHCSSLKLKKVKVRTGQSLVFSFSLKNKSRTKSVNFILDYVIHFKKANGGTSPKVFKLKAGTLLPGQELTIIKVHKMKLVTTRKYYEGEQKISLKLNGRELSPVTWSYSISGRHEKRT